MSSKTKIVVLRMKEVVYTGLLAGIGLVLIILLLILFWPGKNTASDLVSPTSSASQQPSGILQETSGNAIAYIPGIYRAQLVLGGQTVEVEAILEQDRISSLRLVNPDDVLTTMYPLLQPTMEHIRTQLYDTQTLDTVTYTSGTKYTSLVLLEAIRNCLEKAAPSAEE